MRELIKKASMPLERKDIRELLFTVLLVAFLDSLARVIYALALGNIVDMYDINIHETSRTVIVAVFMLVISSIILFLFTQKTLIDIEYRYKLKTLRSIVFCEKNERKDISTGRSIADIAIFSKKAAAFLGNGVVQLFRQMFFVLVMIGVIAYYSYFISLTLVVMLAISIFGQFFFSKLLQQLRIKSNTGVRNMMGTMQDMLQGINVIRREEQQAWGEKKIYDSQKKVETIFVRQSFVMGIIMAALYFIALLPLFFLLFFPSYQCSKGTISYRELVILVNLGIPLSERILMIPQNVAVLQQSSADIKSLEKVWFPASKSVSEKRYIETLNSDISLNVNNISYGYNDDNILIDNISKSFEYGHIYFIKGENGSGKTTYANILQGLIKANTGIIAVDTASNGIVMDTQDAEIFKGSLLSNLKDSGIKAEASEIIEWWNKSAFCSLFAQDVVDINIDYKGNNLSGGQRKCVSIARACLSPSRIKIFDEPTANVDCVAREIIAEEIKKCSLNNTIIIISHDNEFDNMFPLRETIWIGEHSDHVKNQDN